MRKLLTYILAIMMCAPVFASAFSKLLKSPDTELKYQAAVEYYEKKDYSKAITLLEDISRSYKGSETAENILYMLADSYYHKKDYISAAHYYEVYTNTYLNGKYYGEALFMLGYSHYKDSPEYDLDQTETYSAIEKLQLYLAVLPRGPHADEAKSMIAELYDKLAFKELANATLYYNLGNHNGNNYRSAVITAQNAMNDYPDSKYIEDYALVVVRAKYKEAINSVHKKKRQRCEDAWDECYYFMREYPESTHLKEVNKLADKLKTILGKDFEVEEDD